MEGFRGIAHRIEYAGEKNGVLFYDDSKGTNVGAVMRALESFSQPVVLLLGGRDKEGDFETLAPLIRERVREMILFGEAREKINGLIGGVVETTPHRHDEGGGGDGRGSRVSRRCRSPLAGVRELRRIHGLQGAGESVSGTGQDTVKMKSASREKKPDLILLLVTLLLVTVGTVMIYSSSSILAMERFRDGQFFLKKQLFFLVLGLLVMVLMTRIPYYKLRKLAWPGIAVSAVLLVRDLDPPSGDPRRRRRPLAQPRGLLLPGLRDGQGRPDPLSGPFPDRRRPTTSGSSARDCSSPSASRGSWSA